MSQVKHNQLLKRFEEDVEKGTGRSVDEIRDTPICEVEKARELRRLYYSSAKTYRKDRKYLTKHCQVYKDMLIEALTKRLNKEAVMLNVALLILKHQGNKCSCQSK